MAMEVFTRRFFSLLEFEKRAKSKNQIRVNLLQTVISRPAFKVSMNNARYAHEKNLTVLLAACV